MADRSGQQLGNYRVIRQIGRGGFAEVYLGEHIYLKTQVAIKLLRTTVTNKDDLDAFLKEAQTIARLVHPNIIRVMDFGVDGETPFQVMDYAPNSTLRERHPKGMQLPLMTIVPYVKQVADALQYAHSERLIHRDVKPENMLLGRNNDVLLSDFGIALVAQSSRYQSTQEVVGTVAYMSPEQIQGKPRPASDQYSLAIVVYEWLSGDRPFHGSFTELCTQHVMAAPPLLREKVPGILPDVEQVVHTALAKDPKQRFMSVQAFAKALEQASQAEQRTYVKPQPTPPPPPSSWSGPVIAPPPPPLAQYRWDTPVQQARFSSDYSYPPVTGPSGGKIAPAVSRNEQVRPWRIGKREVRAMFISVVIIGILGMFAAFLTFVPTSDPNIIVFYILFFILLALAAATPQFFGAVFGPWAGLFAGGVGSLVGLIVFANIGELHYNGTLIPIDQYASAYSSIWPLHLGIALVGFMSGFAAFKRKGRYNIGRTLGFSFLGVLAGTVFAALMTLITQRYSPGSLNSFLLGLGIVALIYIVAGLILLPISLVIYTRIVERRKRR